MHFVNEILTRLFPQKSIYWVCAPGVDPNQNPKPKFNSIYFGILTPKNVKVEKFQTFFKILKKIFLYFSHFFRPKNLWVLRILNVCWFLYQRIKFWIDFGWNVWFLHLIEIEHFSYPCLNLWINYACTK